MVILFNLDNKQKRFRMIKLEAPGLSRSMKKMYDMDLNNSRNKLPVMLHRANFDMSSRNKSIL